VILPELLDLPGRDEARHAAERELSRPAYSAAQPPWFIRLVNWVLDELSKLLSNASASVPGGPWGLLVATVLVVALIGVIVVRLRPSGGLARHDALFGLEAERTAEQHRALAERFAGAGAFDEAVRERLRAVVRELEERGVLDQRAGRTADEVAREAGRAVPDLATALFEGARLFDDIWYGGRPADAEAYGRLVALDEQVRSARLVLA
jgi:hypothetical protein